MKDSLSTAFGHFSKISYKNWRKGQSKEGQRKKDLYNNQKQSKPILCDKNGLWKAELDQHLQKDTEIVLLALGDAKYEVVAYLNNRKDIEIVKL